MANALITIIKKMEGKKAHLRIVTHSLREIGRKKSAVQ